MSNSSVECHHDRVEVPGSIPGTPTPRAPLFAGALSPPFLAREGVSTSRREEPQFQLEGEAGNGILWLEQVSGCQNLM